MEWSKTVFGSNSEMAKYVSINVPGRFFGFCFLLNVWEVKSNLLVRFSDLSHWPQLYLTGIAYCVGEVLFV